MAPLPSPAAQAAATAADKAGGQDARDDELIEGFDKDNADDEAAAAAVAAASEAWTASVGKVDGAGYGEEAPTAKRARADGDADGGAGAALRHRAEGGGGGGGGGSQVYEEFYRPVGAGVIGEVAAFYELKLDGGFPVSCACALSANPHRQAAGTYAPMGARDSVRLGSDAPSLFAALWSRSRACCSCRCVCALGACVSWDSCTRVQTALLSASPTSPSPSSTTSSRPTKSGTSRQV